MRHHTVKIMSGIVLLVLIGSFVYMRNDSDPIPSSLRKQASYVIFVPSTASWKIDEKKLYFDKAAQVLHLTAYNNTTKTTLTITQQATPSQFTDVPQFFPALLDRLNQYESFGTLNGTINLTKPTELQGRTEAILNRDGTLLFAYSRPEMATKEWRKLFNDMRELKPLN